MNAFTYTQAHICKMMYHRFHNGSHTDKSLRRIFQNLVRITDMRLFSRCEYQSFQGVVYAFHPGLFTGMTFRL